MSQIKCIVLGSDLVSALETVRSHLLSREEILANAVSASGGLSGVYFLIDGDEIVYVGQSINAFARIATHAGEGRNMEIPNASAPRKFDKTAVILCPIEHLDTLEGAYIKKFGPKYNWSRNGRGGGVSSAPKLALTPDMIEKAKELCEGGATDGDLGKYFDVSRVTIQRWKGISPAFRIAVNEGKIAARDKR